MSNRALKRFSISVWSLPVVFLFFFFLRAGTAFSYADSPVITGMSFDMGTLRELAPGSDNWVITWADDDHQYTSWGDGGGFGGTNEAGRVSLGFGRVQGSKDDYTGHNVWGGHETENPARFVGKSYGMLSIDGTLYAWVCGVHGEGSGTDAYVNQRLYVSTDHAASWTLSGVEFTQGSFSGNPGFFCPTFLNFGRDYDGARDDYVYSYAPEIKNAGDWDVQFPGRITLMRVLKGQVTNLSAYEFFQGLDGSDNPTWTNDVNGRVPVWEDSANGVMRISVSYNPGIRRYLLIAQQKDRHRDDDGYMGVYDAPEPWGPWTAVLYVNPWSIGLQNETKTVFWNFSNKWLSADGKDFVLVYTGEGEDNWGTVEGRFEVVDIPVDESEPPPDTPPDEVMETVDTADAFDAPDTTRPDIGPDTVPDTAGDTGPVDAADTGVEPPGETNGGCGCSVAR